MTTDDVSTAIPVPYHVAIIPDGNRRWARQQHLPTSEGHRAGARVTEKIIERALALGITALSFWGSSEDNLRKRPIEEKAALLMLYEEYFSRLIHNEQIHREEVCITAIGQWEAQFPASLVALIRSCCERTAHYAKRHLFLLLAYNGDDDMVRAVQRIVEKGILPSAITRETIKNSLSTAVLPPVDLMIRTGGEPHLSTGFLMWETSNAQLYFSEKLFPDFTPDDFAVAVRSVTQRSRRFGQ